MKDHFMKARPSRILHTMLRVNSIENSLKFYRDLLGMTEFRREDYPTGQFKLCFVGYGSEESESVIELTENYDATEYHHGDKFGHIALEVNEIYGTCNALKQRGVSFVREPGPMTHTASNGACDIIAFIEDPDGNRIEIIQSLKPH